MATPIVIESPTTSPPCFVDKRFYPHMFLIPAVIIITVLAFLHKNKNGSCGGRLGLVVPIDFFGLDHNRCAIAAAFGAAAGSISSIVLTSFIESTTGSKWLDALESLGIAIEYAFLHYPMFACLTTDFKLTGASMGLLYTLTWIIVQCLEDFDQCGSLQSMEAYEIVLEVLVEFPVVMCTLFLAVKYTAVLGQELNKRRQATDLYLDPEREDSERKPSVFVKPWLRCYVKGIFRPRLRHEEVGLKRLIHKLYNPHPDFRFSTQTVSIVLVCTILVYQMTFSFVHIGINWNVPTLRISVITSSCFCCLLCTVMVARFMESHKNRMLSMFKGDISFLPRGVTRSHLMVAKSMRYPGFHIAYLLWGYIVMLMAINAIVFCFILLLRDDSVGQLVKEIILFALPFIVFAVILWLILIVSAMTIFRDRSFPSKAIAIKNRNLYLVFSYFFFFIGLLVGFFSAILRLLKSGLVGLVLIQRVDKSVMPDGFQRFDRGFAAYVGYLHVQAAHRNPVLRVFCQIVCDASDSTRLGNSNVRYSTKTRNKWLLLRTLIWNPQIKTQRKHVLERPLVNNVYYQGASVQELDPKNDR